MVFNGIFWLFYGRLEAVDDNLGSSTDIKEHRIKWRSFQQSATNFTRQTHRIHRAATKIFSRKRLFKNLFSHSTLPNWKYDLHKCFNRISIWQFVLLLNLYQSCSVYYCRDGIKLETTFHFDSFFFFWNLSI